MDKPKKCLECGLVEKLTRGLCHKHYSAAMKKIARGLVSEQTLTKQNKLLPGKAKDRGIAKERDNKMFLLGSNKRGHAATPDQCLVRHCKHKKRNKRGLCVTHHSYAWDLIRKGKANEEDLIKRRLMRSNKTNDKASIKRKNIEKPKKRVRIRKETPICSFAECKFKARAGGLCRRHRNQDKKINNTPPKPINQSAAFEPEIKEKAPWFDVEIDGDSARW